MSRRFNIQQLPTGSYNISGSFSGSFQGDGSGLTGITATINTSSLVTTSSFNNFTSSIQTEVDNLTSQTGSYVLNSQTGSFATTGSNNFIGDQVITGSLTVSGSSTFTNIGPSIFSGSVNVSSSIETDTLKVRGGTGNEGTFVWNSVDNTVDLRLNDVTLQLGQETVYHVINQTGTQINNGEVVYVVGVSSDKLSVAPYSASMNVEADLVLGLATENIPDTQFGFITQFGMVRDINTAGFGVGTVLYADTGSSGYTDIAPTPPDHTIFLGFVTKEDATEGQIELNVRHLRDADEIKTNLSGSGLSSTNVEAALLELQANKVNVGALSSNIILYPTTGSSPIPGYLRMVSDISDPDYNTTAVDINTGAISSLSGQLIASLASDEGLFIGNPGIINVTTLGNIRKVSGNRNAYFYYELYQSSSLGETLVATSDNTPDITNTSYEEFFASALLNNGIWSATDRVVIKWYGVKASGGGNNPTYQFQLGGTEPVRTLLPVPVSVVPSEDADGIQTDTSNFNNILSGADTDVQKALDTLDDHSHTLQQVTDEGNITTDRIIVGDLTVDTDTLYTNGSNVGIGTTNLPEKLTVEGNISASAFIGDGSQLTGIVASKWSGSNPITRDSNVEITGSFKVAGQTTLSTTGSGTLKVQGSGSAQPLFLVTGSIGELVSVIDDDDPNAPLLVVSGSAGQLFVVENSTTGSLLQIYNNDSDSVFEVNGDAEIVYGVSSSIFATQYTAIPVTASYQTIYSIETASYSGAFVNYTVVSASNARAGQLMSVWNSGTASYTETTTTDIGDTSQIAFDVIMTGSVAQIAVSASLTVDWQVKTALNIL